MIKHIVMFKLLDFAESATKKENAIMIKQILDDLPKKIHEIKYFEVGINIKESERAFDIVIISEFDSVEDLDKYIKHPEHQNAVQYISLRKEDSKSVDFEVKQS